jgi:hypothetical protein
MIISVPFFVLVQETARDTSSDVTEDVSLVLFHALLECGETLFCSFFPYCDGAPVWFEH